MTDLQKSVAEVSAPWVDSPYYVDAERWTWLFWNDGTPFNLLFRKLDLECVLELACGHGRHSERVAPAARHLVLIDVIAANIDMCRTRLPSFPDVEYQVNNGFDFRPTPNDACSAIFCFDAMVHFSPDIVESYVCDAARVLRPGGRALFHHSNYAAPLDRHYGQNPHARNHMTAAKFAALSKQAGLTVLEQEIIAWGNEPELDCLSLIEKPA